MNSTLKYFTYTLFAIILGFGVSYFLYEPSCTPDERAEKQIVNSLRFRELSLEYNPAQNPTTPHPLTKNKLSDVLAMPDSAIKLDRLRSHIDSLSLTKTKELFDHYFSLIKSKGLNHSLTKCLFSHWTKLNPEQAFREAIRLELLTDTPINTESPPTPMATSALAAYIFSLWTKQDLNEASRFFQYKMSLFGNTTLARILAQEWARQSPDQLHAWINTHTPNQKNFLYEQAFPVLCEQSAPDEFLTLIKSFDLNDNLLTKAYKTLIAHWTKNAPDEVLSWLKTLPSDTALTLDSVYRQSLSLHHPEKAFAQYKNTPDKLNYHELLTLTQQLGKTNPEAIAPWVDSLSDEKQDFALRGLIVSWSRIDSQKALNWINTLKNQQNQGLALLYYAQNVPHLTSKQKSLYSIKGFQYLCTPLQMKGIYWGYYRQCTTPPSLGQLKPFSQDDFQAFSQTLKAEIDKLP